MTQKHTNSISTDTSTKFSNTVLDWLEKNYPIYQREMHNATWVERRKKYGDDVEIETDKAQAEIDSIIKAKQITDKTKAFEYVIKSQTTVQI